MRIIYIDHVTEETVTMSICTGPTDIWTTTTIPTVTYSPSGWYLATTNFLYGIATDSTGNVYVSGIHLDTDYYELGILLTKYSDQGDMIWSRRMESSTYFSLYNPVGVIVDNDDDVVVFGTVGAFSPVRRVAIFKYDSAGNLQWQNEIQDLRIDDNSASISPAIGSDNSIYIMGHLANTSLQDFQVTIKLNASGNIVWQKVIDGSSNYGTSYNRNYSECIAMDSNDNSYVVVTTYLSLTDVAKLVKRDSSGNLLWIQELSSTESVFAEAVAVDSADNVYVLVYGVPSNTRFMLKFAADGSLLWQKSLTHPNQFNTSPGHLYISSTDQIYGVYAPNVGKDVTYFKMDVNGNMIWNKVLATKWSEPYYDPYLDYDPYSVELVRIAFNNNDDMYLTSSDYVRISPIFKLPTEEVVDHFGNFSVSPGQLVTNTGGLSLSNVTTSYTEFTGNFSSVAGILSNISLNITNTKTNIFLQTDRTVFNNLMSFNRQFARGGVTLLDDCTIVVGGYVAWFNANTSSEFSRMFSTSTDGGATYSEFADFYPYQAGFYGYDPLTENQEWQVTAKPVSLGNVIYIVHNNMLNTPNDGYNYNFTITSKSIDKGLTWTHNISSGSALSTVDSAVSNVALYSLDNNFDGSESYPRSNLFISLTQDEGQTWTTTQLLDDTMLVASFANSYVPDDVSLGIDQNGHCAVAAMGFLASEYSTTSLQAIYFVRPTSANTWATPQLIYSDLMAPVDPNFNYEIDQYDRLKMLVLKNSPGVILIFFTNKWEDSVLYLRSTDYGVTWSSVQIAHSGISDNYNGILNSNGPSFDAVELHNGDVILVLPTRYIPPHFSFTATSYLKSTDSGSSFVDTGWIATVDQFYNNTTEYKINGLGMDALASGNQVLLLCSASPVLNETLYSIRFNPVPSSPTLLSSAATAAYGSAFAISPNGNYLVVSDPEASVHPYGRIGRVHGYSLSGSTPTFIWSGDILPVATDPAVDSYARLGDVVSVADDGTVAAVSSYNNVMIFRNGVLTESFSMSPGSAVGAFSTFKITPDGNRIFASNFGPTVVWAYNGGTWSLELDAGYIACADINAAGDRIIAVESFYNPVVSGTSYRLLIYKRTGSTWNSTVGPILSPTLSYGAITLSPSGNRLCVRVSGSNDMIFFNYDNDVTLTQTGAQQFTQATNGITRLKLSQDGNTMVFAVPLNSYSSGQIYQNIIGLYKFTRNIVTGYWNLAQTFELPTTPESAKYSYYYYDYYTNLSINDTASVIVTGQRRLNGYSHEANVDGALIYTTSNIADVMTVPGFP